MSESLAGLKRTCKCTEINETNIGQEVTLMGWVQKRRNLGGLIFVDLRDRSGIIQIVFNIESDSQIFEKASAIRNEYVLAVKGTIAQRGEGAINDKMITGKIEVLVSELRILSSSEPTPIQVDENFSAKDEIKLKYRYLDLRKASMQRNLILRHETARIAREYFFKEGFLEIETPMLTKSTPEGARDYLVPSRVQPGKFYALPQSPQLFKQILMVSGMDRYIQIVKCFRDEDLRADRQPEFTQIDLEMSFVNAEDVQEVNEGFVKRVFKELLNVDVQLPLEKMPYAEAMERYGSDKPDTRFEMELCNISSLVEASGFKVFTDAIAGGGSVRLVNAKGGASFSRKEIDALTDHVKTYGAKGLAWIQIIDNNGETELKSSFTKFLTEDEISSILKAAGADKGDLLCFVADPSEQVVFDALGALRLKLAEKLNLIQEGVFKFLWVTDFPLLEWDEEGGRYCAKHHPFTAPMDEDLELIETDPGKVRAKAYDLILNGCELGGGSIRIHSQELQAKMFELLGFSTEQAWERFGFLLEAFKYGTPPHGGMAYGLDRLVMLMTGSDSIRDVIAFPKVQNASCLMTNAPDFVDDKQLGELGICVDKKDTDK